VAEVDWLPPSKPSVLSPRVNLYIRTTGLRQA